MLETPTQSGPDDPTSEFDPIAPAVDTEAAGSATAKEHAPEVADPGRMIRTWVWMVLVAGFGLFLVFGSVSAHYWDENALGTYYVPVTHGMQVLEIWRAQVNGLPDVTHQGVLKTVFLVSVFGFIGLSVIALWIATVEIWQAPAADMSNPNDGATVAEAPAAGPAPGASAG